MPIPGPTDAGVHHTGPAVYWQLVQGSVPNFNLALPSQINGDQHRLVLFIRALSRTLQPCEL